MNPPAIDESALVDCPDHDFVHGICCSCGLHEADWIGDGCSGCHRTECLKLRERLAAAEAVVEAARNIPDRPSAAHRLMTPGWKELQEALVAFDSARSR